ncbi:MAG: class I SAM-dependent methyltransferase [Cyclobacteriaceae bacterium]
MNNFDFVAPFYDRLADLVFGDAIEKSATYFLDEIEEGANVLIVGGGTGKILDSLPKCKQVTYLEKSSKMIVRAKRKAPDQAVKFVEMDFLDFETNEQYDFVICPFFLDCFDENSLTKVLERISQSLRTNGGLMVSDFHSKTESTLITLMHYFFRIFSSLESKKLKDIHCFITQSQFQSEKEEFFHQNMIFSRLYRNL